MTQNFPLNSRSIMPNRATRLRIVKYLRSFLSCPLWLMKVHYTNFVNILLLDFFLSWDLVDLVFADNKFDFTPPRPPLRLKPQKYPLPLPLIYTKARCDFSKSSTIRTLYAEKEELHFSKYYKF